MRMLSDNFAARKKTILKYDKITPAVFLNRPNRFLAEVEAVCLKCHVEPDRLEIV